MASGRKGQGFVFYISTPTEIRATPERRTIANTLDYAADLVSLPRIEGERNPEYKQRIMDVNVHPGGPLYDGVVNNLSRAFGYERNRGINIDLKTNSAGQYIATNPRIDILAHKVILYSDWRPDGTEVIDKEIRIYKPDDIGYFINDLVTEINSSECFSSYIYSGIRPNSMSTNLIRTTSDTVLYNDLIEGSNRINLSAQMIVEGSPIFNEKDVFKTEVSSMPTGIGEYYIQYHDGIVHTYDLPSGSYDISYHYATFPMVIDYSLIKIYTLQDEDFQGELFNKVLLDSGEEENGLLNSEGAEVFHQMFLETRFLWGK